MNITKKDLGILVSNDLEITKKQGNKIVESFISIIKNEANLRPVKINKFGTFQFKITKKRIGRNPKTKEKYLINSFKKLTFNAHNHLKKLLN